MEIAEKILKYAAKNYQKDGWYYVYECWTAEEIAEECREHNLKTFESAKNHFADMYGVVNEYRQEIKSYGY